jgi:hypothetical protein
VKRVIPLARFYFDVFGGDLDAFGRGKSDNRLALRFNAKPSAALLGGRNT